MNPDYVVCPGCGTEVAEHDFTHTCPTTPEVQQ